MVQYKTERVSMEQYETHSNMAIQNRMRFNGAIPSKQIAFQWSNTVKTECVSMEQYKTDSVSMEQYKTDSVSMGQYKISCFVPLKSVTSN